MGMLVNKLKNAGMMYYDGFKGMTWGKPLWVLIFLKLFILFAVLRLFFFHPVLEGKTDEEKSDFVGTMLAPTPKENTDNQNN